MGTTGGPKIEKSKLELSIDFANHRTFNRDIASQSLSIQDHGISEYVSFGASSSNPDPLTFISFRYIIY